MCLNFNGINSYSNFSNKTLGMVIERNIGYIMVTANGGMNQQRVAVSDTLSWTGFVISLYPFMILVYYTRFEEYLYS